ncbi:hypothetical protein PoB_003274900 [Plakobranchus ocellatus]|uniref:Uncharacterized protein n=1 Tax=Plakobranchus ocellatus TaxID=259542 RepID=A0AAV4AF13_9GAST|nr:hypothetical protein PoB_003274900 [Plakobranchus ocellatus]
MLYISTENVHGKEDEDKDENDEEEEKRKGEVKDEDEGGEEGEGQDVGSGFELAPALKVPNRSQGGFVRHCATNTPLLK